MLTTVAAPSRRGLCGLLRRAVPRSALAGVALLTAAVPAAAAGDPRTDLVARTITVDGARPAGRPGPAAVRLRARLHFPAEWKVLASGTRLTLRTGGRSCSNTVRVTTRVDLTAAATAADQAAALTPVPRNGYVLDSGTRGRTAWRVVRSSGAGALRLTAAGVVAVNASVARRLAPAPGERAWQEVRVDVRERPGGECHSGVYREALGPAIGDALAIMRARATG
jgi:hypothetical protein